jgi:TolB protein
MRLVLLVLFLLLAACSTVEPSSSSLAILDAGNVVVVNPDGSNRVTIADDSDDPYFQPVWSLDGTMIAFSLASSEPELHVALSDASASFTTGLDSLPFYYSWSAQNELAFLRSGDDGLRLEQTSVVDEALSGPTLITSGQPLYYSWSPDGQMIVTHVGSDRLETAATGNSPESTGVQPGRFQAPVWTDRGIVAIEQGSRDQKLVIIEADGTSTAVATVPGPTSFVTLDAGEKVALLSIAEDTNGLSASYQTVPNLPANRLLVVDSDDGAFERVTDEPVVAYFWSPTGDRLLILDLVPGPQARWSIWTEEGLEEIVRFDPEPSFMRELVPFFDQYAQSVSLWAPDGSAFAFPGSIEDDAGIWVYTLEGELDRINDGTWVAWSP